MSKDNVSIGRYYFLTINLIILITALLSFGLAIQSSFSRLDNQIELLSENLYEEIKSNLKIDVESALNLISLVRSQTEDNYNKTLTENVKNALKISRAYFQSNRTLKTTEEMQQDLRKILRSYRFFHGEGYYFMFTPQGEVILYPVRPELEGENNLDWQDDAGNYFIRDMVHLVNREREGFIDYKIYRPGQVEGSYWKKSYVAYLPELNLVIGSGFYQDDMTDYAQKTAAESLGLFSAGRERPIFGVNYDGLVLIGISKGINRITNPVVGSDNLISEMIELAKSGGGYYEYQLNKDGEGETDQGQISYILPYPEWNWLIGSGSYYRDLSEIIESERTFIVKEVFRSLYILLFILLLIYGLLFLLMRKIASPVKNASEQLIKSMQKALEEDEPIAMEHLAFREFQSIAESANRILRDKQESQKALFQKQKMEALGRLAGGVAHEINNQLTAVMGFADLISTQELNQEGEQFMESLLEGASRASDMVRELLVFSRGEEGPKEPVDVHAILEKIKHFLERTIDKNIQIRLESAAEEATLMGDGNKIYSLFLNLAINSVDAMETGGLILFSTKNIQKGDEKSLQVEIRDNGSGIDQEILEKIFELFFTTKPAGKGTGLGLALVYDIVKEHGGTVTVNSEPGKGTLFTVLFPLNGENNGTAR